MFSAIFPLDTKLFRQPGLWFMGGALIMFSLAAQPPSSVGATVEPPPGHSLLTSTPPPPPSPQTRTPTLSPTPSTPTATATPNYTPVEPPTNTAVPNPAVIYNPLVVK